MHFETDPRLSREMVLTFGSRLRSAFYQNLPGFIDAIEVIDDPEFHELHAGFFSRLGMTFSHGDYASRPEIPARDRIAEGLYHRALGFGPDHRAFLGLGILFQKAGRNREAVRRLEEGIGHFPDSEPLNLCLGISLMNMGEYEKALSFLLKLADSKQAIPHIAACHRQLGNHKQAALYLSIPAEGDNQRFDRGCQCSPSLSSRDP